MSRNTSFTMRNLLRSPYYKIRQEVITKLRRTQQKKNKLLQQQWRIKANCTMNIQQFGLVYPGRLGDTRFHADEWLFTTFWSGSTTSKNAIYFWNFPESYQGQWFPMSIFSLLWWTFSVSQPIPRMFLLRNDSLSSRGIFLAPSCLILILWLIRPLSKMQRW